MRSPSRVRSSRLRTAMLTAVCLSLCICAFSPARASDASDDYARACSAARHKDLPEAFMHFLPLAQGQSPYRETALFAVGEYYVLTNAPTDAVTALASLVREYPDSRYRVFAIWYLMMIAERLGRQEIARGYRQHLIMMRQHSFLFRKSKTWSLRSPLQRHLKVVYYIDKAELYADGVPCAAISF